MKIEGRKGENLSETTNRHYFEKGDIIIEKENANTYCLEIVLDFGILSFTKILQKEKINYSHGSIPIMYGEYDCCFLIGDSVDED